MFESMACGSISEPVKVQCVRNSPLAAHTQHNDEDGDNESRGGGDGPEQQHLAVGGSSEVHPVLHRGHVKVFTHAGSFTPTGSLPLTHSLKHTLHRT